MIFDLCKDMFFFSHNHRCSTKDIVKHTIFIIRRPKKLNQIAFIIFLVKPRHVIACPWLLAYEDVVCVVLYVVNNVLTQYVGDKRG